MEVDEGTYQKSDIADREQNLLHVFNNTILCDTAYIFF